MHHKWHGGGPFGRIWLAFCCLNPLRPGSQYWLLLLQRIMRLRLRAAWPQVLNVGTNARVSDRCICGIACQHTVLQLVHVLQVLHFAVTRK
jgi:hypothetical protein